MPRPVGHFAVKVRVFPVDRRGRERIRDQALDPCVLIADGEGRNALVLQLPAYVKKLLPGGGHREVILRKNIRIVKCTDIGQIGRRGIDAARKAAGLRV